MSTPQPNVNPMQQPALKRALWRNPAFLAGVGALGAFGYLYGYEAYINYKKPTTIPTVPLTNTVPLVSVVETPNPSPSSQTEE